MIEPSLTAQNTFNPIRRLVDRMNIVPPRGKKLISLSIGDPTIFGNFKTHQQIIDSVSEKLKSFQFNGYPPAIGYEFARKAVADAFSTPNVVLTADDVILSSACSGAIEMAINVLCSPGDSILLPAPGFSLYQTICESRGIRCIFYDCLPHKSWEIDLLSLDKLIEPGSTKSILINNPSNPCGSVFSRSHMEDILKVIGKHKLPIIADEVYHGMVFSNAQFTPFGEIPSPVPILTCGGLAKRYMVPGWRIGWIILYDKQNQLQKIRAGLMDLATIILGPNSFTQAALPNILEETPASYYADTNSTLEKHSMFLYNTLSEIPGLDVIKPQGAMYIMVRIQIEKFRDITDDNQFCQMLLSEQGVFCLPASIFKAPGFIRIVITPPIEKIQEACQRISDFCSIHLL